MRRSIPDHGSPSGYFSLQGVHSNLGHDACPNLTHYPQSNGKIERWHKSLKLKSECIRPGTPLSLDDALRLVQGYVEYYNNIRLNSAIGDITPKDMLAGRQLEIHAQRNRRLQEACRHRQLRRRQAA
jgi:putative transposase